MTRTRLASERGAVLINTALTLLIWFSLATFVVDFGVLWVSRNQAQTAADAGAMAGAVARAYEDFDDPPSGSGPAAEVVTAVSGANLVWGLSTPPATSFGCPADIVTPPQRCVRVDISRTGLPTWFGSMLAITSQNVRATASAQVMIANGTNCLRPWAIPDAWTPGTAPGSDFRKYANGSGAVIPFGDDYTPPDAIGPGSGFRFATSNSTHNDFGVSLPLTLATDPAVNPIDQGWLLPLEPAAGYASSVTACNGEAVEVGDQIPLSATLPAASDFDPLYAADPLASWDAMTASVQNSCAPACAPFSPRLVAVAVFDTELFQYRRAVSNWAGCPPSRGSCTPCPGGAACASIVNIVGLFIENAAGANATLSSYPGTIPSTAPKLSADSSFLKAVTLVR